MWQYGCFSIYIMNIQRPKIEWKKIFFRFIVITIINILTSFFMLYVIEKMQIEKQADKYLTIIRYILLLPISGLASKVIATIFFLSILFNLQRIMIFCVLLYQKYAPESMRASCLYTPSCSEYMILAIKKYGCIKGFTKGVKRVRRCHTPNGGIDYP